MTVLFVCSLLLLWNLAGYPILLLLLSAVTGEPSREGASRAASVSVLIAAHNESRHIGARVANAWQKAAVPVEVIVVSDGSTDKTAELAATAGARVFSQARAGKVAALHRATAEAKGDILVLTDANTRFDDGAIDALVLAMRAKGAGIAAGDLHFENSDESGSALGESLYWRYETAIKRAASRCGVLLMGAGGIYAVRRVDWPRAIPADFADDSFVPLLLARAGRRNLFVPEARATERAGTTKRDEWRRRVRMVAQDFRVVSSLRFGLPNLRIFFALVSQKILRWLIFPLACGAVGGAALVLDKSVVGALVRENLAAIGGLFLFGIMMIMISSSMRRVLDAGIYMIGATVAAFVGMALGLLGRSPSTWAVAESTRAGETS